MQALLCALLVVCVGVVSVAGQTVEDRAVAAIVGAFVADAAAMPLHWIYNVVCAYRLLTIILGYHLLSHLRIMVRTDIFACLERNQTSCWLWITRVLLPSLMPLLQVQGGQQLACMLKLSFGEIATKLLGSLCSRLSLRSYVECSTDNRHPCTLS